MLSIKIRHMATLVLLNGAPGSGKSTLARRFAQERPLTLARFVEVALVSSHNDVVGRFEPRSTESEAPEHVAAAALQLRSGGREELIAMYHRMLLVIEERPQTHLIISIENAIDSAYAQLRAVAEGDRNGTP